MSIKSTPREENHSLSDIQGREENKLGFIVEAHSLDVRFEDFEHLFPVLGTPASKEFANDTTAVPCVNHFCQNFLTTASYEDRQYDQH
jgi:hypothetical protein